MAEQTNIEWCDSTFNPWIGCTKVSPACDDCYAARSTPARTLGVQWGSGQPRQRTSPANWRKPMLWNAKPFYECEGCGWRGDAPSTDGGTFTAGLPSCPVCDDLRLKDARRRVFCASLADVFDNEVDPAWRADLFALIGATPNLDWLLLTKRIGNVTTMVYEAAKTTLCLNRPYAAVLPPNVWLGATICNQEEADRDIPKLLATPAAVRFLSIEPMLSLVDATSFLWGKREGVDEICQSCPRDADCECGYHTRSALKLPALHWVIVGGESGPKARDCNIEHVRAIVRQCRDAGVALMVKQLGARPVWTDDDGEPPHAGRISFQDKKGGDWSEWPEDLRVREFPEVSNG